MKKLKVGDEVIVTSLNKTDDAFGLAVGMIKSFNENEVLIVEKVDKGCVWLTGSKFHRHTFSYHINDVRLSHIMPTIILNEEELQEYKLYVEIVLNEAMRSFCAEKAIINDDVIVLFVKIETTYKDGSSSAKRKKIVSRCLKEDSFSISRGLDVCMQKAIAKTLTKDVLK